MEFELTPEITGEIIFAMEDQTGHFLYDSEACRCVAAASAFPDGLPSPGDSDPGDDRYYQIPVWDSVSGFRMMDRFIAQLRNPVAREELRSALSSGRGVFRSFKNILKSRPEIERLWLQFKEREMREIVRQWHESLREYWGLGNIGMEPEETGDIVGQDFTFRRYEEDDEASLETLFDSVSREIALGMSPELSDAIDELRARLSNADAENECVFVAESAEGELVGAAVSAPLPAGSFLTVQLSSIAVYPEYRGLGIGKELLERTIGWWADRGYRWMLFAAPVVPRSFLPVLERSGFTGKGHVSVLDLADTQYH